MISTVSELCLLLAEAQILKLATMATQKSRQVIWRSCLSRKRAELFHRKYAVIDEFKDVSRIRTEVLNVLEHPALFSLELLQTLFDMVMSIIPEKELLEVEKNQNLWKPIVNHAVESLGKRDRDAGTVTFSFTKKLFWDLMESNSVRLWSVKRRAD